MFDDFGDFDEYDDYDDSYVENPWDEDQREDGTPVNNRYNEAEPEYIAPAPVEPEPEETAPEETTSEAVTEETPQSEETHKSETTTNDEPENSPETSSETQPLSETKETENESDSNTHAFLDPTNPATWFLIYALMQNPTEIVETSRHSRNTNVHQAKIKSQTQSTHTTTETANAAPNGKQPFEPKLIIQGIQQLTETTQPTMKYPKTIKIKNPEQLPAETLELFEAIKNNDVSKVKQMVDTLTPYSAQKGAKFSERIAVEPYGPSGFTYIDTLCYAVWLGRPQIIQILLSNKKCCNANQYLYASDKETDIILPLQFAVFKDFPQTTQVLLENGALPQPTLMNDDIWTSPILMAKSGPVTQELMKNDRKNQSQHSALNRTLAEMFGDIKGKALFDAIDNGWVDKALILAEYGANPDNIYEGQNLLSGEHTALTGCFTYMAQVGRNPTFDHPFENVEKMGKVAFALLDWNIDTNLATKDAGSPIIALSQLNGISGLGNLQYKLMKKLLGPDKTTVRYAWNGKSVLDYYKGSYNEGVILCKLRETAGFFQRVADYFLCRD